MHRHHDFGIDHFNIVNGLGKTQRDPLVNRHHQDIDAADIGHGAWFQNMAEQPQMCHTQALRLNNEDRSREAERNTILLNIGRYGINTQILDPDVMPRQSRTGVLAF